MSDVIASLQVMIDFFLLLATLGFLIYVKGLEKLIEEEGRKERVIAVVFFVTGMVLIGVGFLWSSYSYNCLWFVKNSALPPTSDSIPLMMH